MSRQPQSFSYRELIRDSFIECEWQFGPAYRMYLLNGGDAGPDAFRSWIAGKTTPQADDFAILMHVFRQRLRELDKKVWLPGDLPLPRTAGGDDGSSASDGTILYSSQPPADLGFRALATA